MWDGETPLGLLCTCGCWVLVSETAEAAEAGAVDHGRFDAQGGGGWLAEVPSLRMTT
jgi:hypothetical protein